MNAVPPVLLERTCDAARSGMTAEEIMRYSAELVTQHGEAFMLAHPYYPGCGTRFQWYGLGNCNCPECGRTYMVSMERYKAGLYAPKSL
jgi:hypothetical protein